MMQFDYPWISSGRTWQFNPAVDRDNALLAKALICNSSGANHVLHYCWREALAERTPAIDGYEFLTEPPYIYLRVPFSLNGTEAVVVHVAMRRILQDGLPGPDGAARYRCLRCDKKPGNRAARFRERPKTYFQGGDLQAALRLFDDFLRGREQAERLLIWPQGAWVRQWEREFSRPSEYLDSLDYEFDVVTPDLLDRMS